MTDSSFKPVRGSEARLIRHPARRRGWAGSPAKGRDVGSWAGFGNTMHRFIAEELTAASVRGCPPPPLPFPNTPQFTFGRARNGLLHFSQRPGRILRKRLPLFFPPFPSDFTTFKVSADPIGLFACRVVSLPRSSQRDTPVVLNDIFLSVIAGFKKGAEIIRGSRTFSPGIFFFVQCSNVPT